MRSLFCLCVLLFAGCGDGIQLYPITGNVTVDGKAQEGLMVAFAPQDGGMSGAGRTDASGNYTITSTKGKGLPAGTYKVAIKEVTVVENNSEEKEAAASSDSSSYEQLAMGGGADQYRKAAKEKKLLPAKYNDQTTLQETVAETDNTFNFALETQ